MLHRERVKKKKKVIKKNNCFTEKEKVIERKGQDFSLFLTHGYLARTV